MAYIKYDAVIRLLHFDNHSDKWALKKTNDDGDSLSVIAENLGRGGGRNALKNATLRMSFEGRQKPSLQRESLRNAIRASATVLSQEALANLDA